MTPNNRRVITNSFTKSWPAGHEEQAIEAYHYTPEHAAEALAGHLWATGDQRTVYTINVLADGLTRSFNVACEMLPTFRADEVTP